MQDCSISSALALEMLQSCKKLSNYCFKHWGWGRMMAISQTTFWNAFSWKKTFLLWHLFYKVKLTTCQHRNAWQRTGDNSIPDPMITWLTDKPGIPWGYSYIEGILPKGPYLSCVSMVGRALLAEYPRYIYKWMNCVTRAPHDTGSRAERGAITRPEGW